VQCSAISCDFVVWLDGRPVSPALVGDKGASLSNLVALGAPVPPAFSLSTDAYAVMAEAAGLPVRPSDVSDDDLPAIRAVIEASPLPEDIRAALHEAAGELSDLAGGEVSVVVRASHTEQDPTAFAGQHDTLIDIRDADALEDAVKRCWASHWTRQAVASRRQAGRAVDHAGIAVVVQQMVRSDVSFVAFAADSISGPSDYVLINASWGLGDVLASSMITPDQVIADAHGAIHEYMIGEKAEMVMPRADGPGTQSVPVPRVLRTVPVLGREQVRAIATMARQLSHALGYPADLEGAFVGSQLMLFQARPTIATVGIAA
jgi:rifampicin phosphotransferase